MPDTPLSSLDLDVPAWIDQELTTADVAAIVQGGCASGAYMPAVTYYTARKTMAEHGDEILQSIEECFGELPGPPTGSSWSGISVFYLSMAVELWASNADSQIEEARMVRDGSFAESEGEDE